MLISSSGEEKNEIYICHNFCLMYKLKSSIEDSEDLPISFLRYYNSRKRND